MAMMHCTFASAVLMRQCAMNVFIPERPHSDGKKGFPVLYLLHGRSDNEETYTFQGVNRLFRDRELIVVMPDGARSFYTDMVSGERYWTFVSEELPRLVSVMFPARTEREATFAAGLSMGGYGALKLGLRHPERFSRIAAMSSVADIGWAGRPEGGMSDTEVNAIFGSRTAMLGGENDLFHLAEGFAPDAVRPELWMRCGTEDILIAENRAFRDHLQKLGHWRLDYREGPGSHTWEYWLGVMPSLLDFLEGKAQ